MLGVNRTKKTSKKFQNSCLQRCWVWRHFSVPRTVYEKCIGISWTL